jgi:hypothetical protein
MTLAVFFWILMLIWVVGGVGVRWSSPPQPGLPGWWWVPDLLLFALLLALGWHAFGAPLKP